jgi:hypothetical protein
VAATTLLAFLVGIFTAETYLRRLHALLLIGKDQCWRRQTNTALASLLIREALSCVCRESLFDIVVGLYLLLRKTLVNRLKLSRRYLFARPVLQKSFSGRVVDRLFGCEIQQSRVDRAKRYAEVLLFKDDGHKFKKTVRKLAKLKLLRADCFEFDL